MYPNASFTIATASVHFLHAEIHAARHVIAESFMLRREEIVFEYQEVCILSRSDGALFVLYAELYSAVDGIAQEHFVDEEGVPIKVFCTPEQRIIQHRKAT